MAGAGGARGGAGAPGAERLRARRGGGVPVAGAGAAGLAGVAGAGRCAAVVAGLGPGGGGDAYRHFFTSIFIFGLEVSTILCTFALRLNGAGVPRKNGRFYRAGRPGH